MCSIYILTIFRPAMKMQGRVENRPPRILSELEQQHRGPRQLLPLAVKLKFLQRRQSLGQVKVPSLQP